MLFYPCCVLVGLQNHRQRFFRCDDIETLRGIIIAFQLLQLFNTRIDGLNVGSDGTFAAVSPLICDGDAIKGIHLPPTLQASETSSSAKPLSFSTAVENFEKELIIDALKKNNGNQTKTAGYLDTSLRIINYKIHQYGIDPKKYKI